MVKRKTPPMYVADTENNVPKSKVYDDTPESSSDVKDVIEVPNETFFKKPKGCRLETRVWAAAICKVLIDPTPDDVVIVNNVNDFLDICSDLPNNSKVYFHNLAYDGPLLLTALIINGFVPSTQEDPFKKAPAGQYVTMITDSRVWYRFTVTFSNGTQIHFCDSLKILPFSVDSIGKSLKTHYQKLKGTIQYDLFRPEGYDPTPMERRYIENDVLVMSQALALLTSRDVDLTKSLTIGSACMTHYKRTLGGGDAEAGNRLYDSLFIELSKELDAELRMAYRGGWCYVNRYNPYINKNQVVDLRHGFKKGHTYDVNSLYPFAMYGKEFPIGNPFDVAPEKFESTANYPYIVKMSVDFTVKKDHLPFIQLKNSSRFAENDYPMSSGGSVEITLTKPDYELFLEHYDMEEREILKVWGFASAVGIFDQYIDYWYHIKETATNPVDRMIAKLMLNNLYGKMAQSMIRNSGEMSLDEDGILRLTPVDGEARGGYIPVGAFITAYARVETVRAAQMNYVNFLYGDTDSLHIIGEAVGIAIGTKLGEWDHEAVWDIARFVRQKTYIERIIEKEQKGPDGKFFGPCTPEISIKAAGANDLVKERMKHKLTEFVDGQWKHKRLTRDENDKCTNDRRTDEEIFNRFTHGVTEAGSLKRKSAVGGPVLEERTFSIAGGDGVKNPLTGVEDTEWLLVA